MERLQQSAFEEVIVTNTLPIPAERRFDDLTVLSIGPLIARAIKEVFEDGSVTSLFGGQSSLTVSRSRGRAQLMRINGC